MRFELLGPVSVVVDEHRHTVARAQARGVLALLLLNAGRGLSPAAVIEAMWGGAAPSTAKAQLHNAVRDIRLLLAGLGSAEVIVTERFGYRADVAPSDVDALLFQQWVREAEAAMRAGDPDAAASRLRAALGLWTGEPLANVAGAFAEPAAAKLVDLRLTAVEDLADLDVRHGRPEVTAAELAPLVHAYPMRERLRARLMMALYHSGRRAEALRSAREYRALLAEQEGLDPGAEIVAAEAAVRADPPSGAVAPRSVARDPQRHRPAQLPAEPAGFVARERELAQLDAVALAGAVGVAAPSVVALVGPGGIGKTALAVAWGNRRRDAFDDGQLYLNLHGFGLQPPVDPFEATARMLRGLGQPDDTLPPTLDERAALLRSVTAGRRLLIVLDNAASTEQVRPLLPGVGRHVTLVTSRLRLDGLAVGEGARHLPLEPLGRAGAVELLRANLGRPVAGGLLAEVARLTEGLPLALRIVAARLSALPPTDEGPFVTDLADERQRLSALSLAAEDTAVRGAFARSYHALSDAGRAVFRAFGLLPSPETAVAPCAALLGRPVADTETCLAELHAGHLVQRTPAGRYQMHDLMRLYARELADQEPARDRAGAEDRLLRWYLAAADRADSMMRPYRTPGFTAEPAPGTPEFADVEAALSWCYREADNLLNAVARAEPDHPVLCWQLTLALAGWLDRQLDRPAWLAVCETGLRAAIAVGDREAEAMMRQSQAIAHAYLHRYDLAIDAFARVLAVRREVGPPRALAIALMNLGNAYVQTGQDDEGMARLTEALAILEPLDDAMLVGVVHNNLGWAHRTAGRHEQAIDCHTRAAEIGRACDVPLSVASAETNLAAALADCGRDQEAASHWEIAADYARRVGDTALEADATAGLGRSRLRLGSYQLARQNLVAALAVYEILGDSRAEQIAEISAILESAPLR